MESCCGKDGCCSTEQKTVSKPERVKMLKEYKKELEKALKDVDKQLKELA